MTQGKIHYRRLAPCLLAIVIDALGFGLVYPIMTAIFTATPSPVLPVGTTDSMRHFYLGLGFMLYPFCMLFGTAFMGDWSDKIGRKKVLMVCMFGITLSFLSMALGVEFGSLWLLFFGRGLSGLMAGSQPIAQAAIGDISTAATKAKNMSIIAMSYSAGAILGPLIGGITSDHAIVSWFNYSTPFYLAAGLALIALIWIYTSFQETFTSLTKQRIRLLRPIKIFIEAFEHASIRLLAISFLLFQIGFSLFFQYILVQMKYEHNYSVWQLGALNGIIGIGFAVGLLVGIPYVVKNWKENGFSMVTGILTGIGILLVAINYIALLQWLLAFLVAFFDIIMFTGCLTLFSNAVGPRQQGWAMGIANAAMAVAWALTGLASNLLNLLGTRGLLLVGGVCLIISALILLIPRPAPALA